MLHVFHDPRRSLRGGILGHTEPQEEGPTWSPTEKLKFGPKWAANHAQHGLKYTSKVLIMACVFWYKFDFYLYFY